MTKLDHLNRLLGTRLGEDAAGPKKLAGTTRMHSAYVLELDRIAADPEQVRRTFDQDELMELAGSLRDVGQLQPVVVRYVAEIDRYVLVAGERRFRAAQLAGLKTLNAVVVDAPGDRAQLTHLQLVENAVRADVSPVDAAAAMRSLMAAWGCTQGELAQRLNMSQSRVSRTLAILDLPVEVRQQVVAGEVAPTAAVKRTPRRRRTKSATRTKRSCIAGVATVVPRPGFTVAQVLELLLELERRRDAA
jgi:ParB family chromosome partitioning protein